MTERAGAPRIGHREHVVRFVLPNKLEIGAADQLGPHLSAADRFESAIGCGRTAPDLKTYPSPFTRGKLIHVIGQ
jgi:hypothetical protein